MEHPDLSGQYRASRFGNLHLEMLELDDARVELLSQAGDDLLLREQQCLQSINIVGQVSEVECGPSLREGADLCKANGGVKCDRAPPGDAFEQHPQLCLR